MIRATITDKDAFSSLSECQVLAYLERHGWSIFEEREYGYLFYNQIDYDDNGHIPIILAKQIAGDYVRRLSEVFTTLSMLEDRSQLDIFVEMGGVL